ncbi:MAG: TIM-barrel domain-containing protein, partial [Bacteroidia bacterium]
EVYAYKKMYADEKFIGLGEKTGNLNRRGNSYQHWNSDVPAYAMNADPLYKTLPFYMGIQGNKTYGIFLDNTHRSYFDFGASTDEQFMRFGAADGELNYYFFGANSVKEIIEDYTWLTGRMKLPPLWSLGYQQCRWSYYPDTEVLNLARTFREKKIPADVIYLDINYMDAYKIFTFHPEHFPKPKKMIDELKEMGFHLVVIVDPGIKIEKGYEQYESGVNNNFFVKYPNGKFYTGSVWPGRCHFPDFTSEEVRNWWGKQFQIYTDAGVEGFWNDMNEPAAWGQNIPNLIEFQYEGKKTTLNEARNVYGLQMSRATSEGTAKLMGNKRNFVLTRAAYSGIQRYSAVWTGDNVSNDEHLILGTRLVSSLGLTGIAFAGPDVGGFISEPNKDLFLRWLSIGTFTPFLRNHSEINSKDQEPWTFGEWAEEIARKNINLRYQLLPYLYSTFKEASVSGMPVARSLAIDYTFDNNIYDWGFQNQYLFGHAFLIAPVTSKERYLKVYLPEGNWYNYYTNEKHAGNQQLIVEAPLEKLPVFVKAGAIVPMQNVVQHTQETPKDTLEIHLYHDANGISSFIYYEDDGETYDYEKGAYYQRDLTLDDKKGSLRFSAVEGKFTSRFRYARLHLHGFGKETKISDKEAVALKNEAFEVKYR